MKAPLIEFGSELLLGLTAMTTDLQFTELVGQRLSRPRDIAIDFGGDLVLGQRSAVTQLAHRLFARPAELMKSGVDDETAVLLLQRTAPAT